MTKNSLRRPSATRRASPSIRFASVGALLGLLVAPTAYAQPVTVRGPLMAGHEPTGHVQGVELVARRWISGTRFQFDIPVGGDDGKAALLHGTVDTSQPDSIVVGRVCSDVAISPVEKASDDFAVTMLADAEAQLVSRSARGIVIKVPPAVPNAMEEERLVPLAALAAVCPQGTAASSKQPDLTCEPFAFHSRPDESSASFELNAARRIVAKPQEDGWQRVEYDDFNGFRWRGFARGAPKCSEAPKAGAIAGSGGMVGMQPTPCRQALLPRGAKLRAADRKTLLLTVRQDFEARLCTTERPFEWEVDLEAGAGEATVRGFFDGSPLPLRGSAAPQ